MKIRQGFVSNSSSSSFVLIGISKWGFGAEKAEAIINALGLDESDDWELNFGKRGFNIHQQGQFLNEDGISLFMNDCEISCVGMDIKNELANDQTVSQLKKEFIKKN